MVGFLLKKEEGLHVYTDDQNLGFRVEIPVNERDAMVFGRNTALPVGEQNIKECLLAFRDFAAHEDNYGAKLSLRILPHLQSKITQDLLDELLQTGNGSGKIIDRDTLEKNVVKCQKKFYVDDIVKKIQKGDYKLLSNEALIPRAQELADFKIIHAAAFINQTKVDEGKYNKTAEEAKLTNPNVYEYAIVNGRNEIIATVMYHMTDIAYVADLIVHTDWRSKELFANNIAASGLAQALMVLTFEQLKDKFKDTTHAWYIAGGHGTKGVGKHLYEEVFPSVDLDKEKQKEIGLLLFFTKPGLKLLEVANCERVPKSAHEPTLIVRSKDDPEVLKAANAALARQIKELAPQSMFKQPVLSPQSQELSQTLRATNQP